MHIITDLILSILLAGERKKKVFRGFRNFVEIRSAIPGSTRFYIPSLKNNIKAFQSINQQLVKVNPTNQIIIPI